MVIFADGESASITAQAIATLRQNLKLKTEFKFSKSSDYVRDRFFECVARCPFTVRAVIVRKEALHSTHVRNQSDGFYNYFVRMLMAHDDGTLDAARVRIDGSGGHDFQRALNRYLRRELGARIKEVTCPIRTRSAHATRRHVHRGYYSGRARSRGSGPVETDTQAAYF